MWKWLISSGPGHAHVAAQDGCDLAGNGAAQSDDTRELVGTTCCRWRHPPTLPHPYAEVQATSASAVWPRAGLASSPADNASSSRSERERIAETGRREAGGGIGEGVDKLEGGVCED